MYICVSAWAYAMCIQAPTKARRVLELKLKAVVSLGTGNEETSAREALSRLLSGPQSHLSKHNSIMSEHYQALIIPGRAHCFLYPWESMKLLIHFFWGGVSFLRIRCENSKPLSNDTCTRNILPVPELACSRPQLLTFIKLYFMKILLQKAHNTLRCMLFPSNVK